MSEISKEVKVIEGAAASLFQKFIDAIKGLLDTHPSQNEKTQAHLAALAEVRDALPPEQHASVAGLAASAGFALPLPAPAAAQTAGAARESGAGNQGILGAPPNLQVLPKPGENGAGPDLPVPGTTETVGTPETTPPPPDDKAEEDLAAKAAGGTPAPAEPAPAPSSVAHPVGM